MELYSAPGGCTSHCIRIVLAEKGIETDIHNASIDQLPENLAGLNPQQSLPTLVDRDLMLYDYRVIMEYLDERFPHPPLLPPDPINRARARLALNRIDNDWFSLLPALEAGKGAECERARKRLREELMATASVFAASPFFFSEEFSLLDCSLAPLLWRLPHYNISFTKSTKSGKQILRYAESLFARPTFQASLSSVELGLR